MVKTAVVAVVVVLEDELCEAPGLFMSYLSEVKKARHRGDVYCKAWYLSWARNSSLRGCTQPTQGRGTKPRYSGFPSAISHSI